MTKKSFKPTVEEDFNRPYEVTLTEGQISTILWTMEGYINGSDDYDEDSEYGKDVNRIFEILEGAVDSYYDAKEVEECIVEGNDYADCVDTLVDKMNTSKETYSQIPSRY